MSDPNPAAETALDKAIADCLAELELLSAASEDYAKINDQLTKLHRLKQEEEKLLLEDVATSNKFILGRQELHNQQAAHFTRKPISKDVLITTGGSLLGIALIIWHERDHVMNRTALDFLKRLR